MPPEAFLKFLTEEQKEFLILEECKELIRSFESSEVKTSFSKQGFTHFLMFNDWQVSMIYCKTLYSALL